MSNMSTLNQSSRQKQLKVNDDDKVFVDLYNRQYIYINIYIYHYKDMWDSLIWHNAELALSSSFF